MRFNSKKSAFVISTVNRNSYTVILLRDKVLYTGQPILWKKFPRHAYLKYEQV